MENLKSEFKCDITQRLRQANAQVLSLEDYRAQRFWRCPAGSAGSADDASSYGVVGTGLVRGDTKLLGKRNGLVYCVCFFTVGVLDR